jgi:uncharacterized protein
VKEFEMTANQPSEDGNPFPGILISAGWIILYFVLQIVATVAAVIVVSSLSGSPAGTVSPISIVWGIIAAGVLLLILLWAYLRKASRADQLGLMTFGKLSWVKIFGLALPLLVGVYLFNFVYATYVIPGIDMQKEITDLIKNIPRTPLNIVLGFTAIAILAPLVEEVLFRGLLQNALGHKMPAFAAIALSSFVFAAIHLQPYAIPPLMVLGAAFGYIYHKTGSLRINIMLHAVNNAVALLML